MSTIVCSQCEKKIKIVAFKSDQWSSDTPAQNLLCRPCAGVLIGEDLTGREIKRPEIEAMAAALAVTETPEETAVDEVDPEVGTVVETVAAVALPAPDEVKADAVVAQPEAPVKPRFCGLCGGEIPREHPHALHSSCYGAMCVYYAENGVIYTGRGKKQRVVNVDEEMKWISENLEQTIKYNPDLEFSAAVHIYDDMAVVAYRAGEGLRALRFAWVARDAAARLYVNKMYDGYLVPKSNKLRDDGLLTDEIEQMLIDVEVLIGKERYIAAAYVLRGNFDKNQSGAKHLVGKAYQTPETMRTFKQVEEQFAALRQGEVDAPEETRQLYKQANRLLAEDPWKANKMALRVVETLKPVIAEAERLRTEALADSLTLRARVFANVAPEDVGELEELLGEADGVRSNRKAKVQPERGDGGPKRREKRRTRKVETEESIAASLAKEEVLTVLEPTAAPA